jgi:hypothetical protein
MIISPMCPAGRQIIQDLLTFSWTNVDHDEASHGHLTDNARCGRSAHRVFS